MRTFSFRPALTLRGRKSRGVRGWAGKPLHPAMTDIPVGAYMLAGAFDTISAIGHANLWAHDFYRAATFTLVGGAAVSVLAALTGWAEWRDSPKGTQVRRTVNAHAWTMIALTIVVLTNIGLRLFVFSAELTTIGLLLALSLVAAALTTLGGTIGGSLAYDYGYSVEAAGDHPVWHRNEVDVFPGHTPKLSQTQTVKSQPSERPADVSPAPDRADR